MQPSEKLLQQLAKEEKKEGEIYLRSVLNNRLHWFEAIHERWFRFKIGDFRLGRQSADWKVNVGISGLGQERLLLYHRPLTIFNGVADLLKTAN